MSFPLNDHQYASCSTSNPSGKFSELLYSQLRFGVYEVAARCAGV